MSDRVTWNTVLSVNAVASFTQLVGADVDEDDVIVGPDVLHHPVDGGGHLDPHKVDAVQPGDGLVELSLVNLPAPGDDETFH